MKCKKHPTILWEFLRPKVNIVHIDYRGASPPAFHPRQPVHNNDAVRPATADRIAIEQQNKPTVKEQHSYESNH